MTIDEVRIKFLDFFRDKGHKIVPSDSLVPKNDPTLMFTSAGMNQFKDYFLGKLKDISRAASCQKCLRTGDLDRVGKTAYHHTFFEMLGNFSFGDYFKEEAISWAWEFLTEVLDIDKNRLWASVYFEDEESRIIWKDKIGLAEERIVKMGAEDNFWPSNGLEDGPDGPCGPCSEIYFDRGEDKGCGRKDCSPACSCGRFVEVWNLVFTQFNRVGYKKTEPLPAKNIDTGMGLERLCSVLQAKDSNFETDVFVPLITEIKTYFNKPQDSLIYAIADHSRAAVFAVSDNIYPSNEGRGYVIRRIIRRALWHSFSLGRQKPLLYKLVPVIGKIMQKPYPEIYNSKENIAKIILSEEERFISTLTKGRQILLEFFREAEKANKVISGDKVFKLYDTFGFPVELTEFLAREKGIKLDYEGFNALLSKQRETSRQNSKFAELVFVQDKYPLDFEVEFTGYETSRQEGVILGIVENNKEVSRAEAGVSADLILDKTCFYPSSGGQQNDKGVILTREGGKFIVEEVVKANKMIIHRGRVNSGTFVRGSRVACEADEKRRQALMRAHTSTHLLQSALRRVLGGHITQQGSLVEEDRLHFDFNHFRKLSLEEIKAIERKVNEFILKSAEVKKYYLPFSEAKKDKDILAFFEEKYGEQVRVVEVEGISRELCGGLHLNNSSQAGIFKIISSSSVSSGIRRIEALTGLKAYEYLTGKEDVLNKISQLAKTSYESLPSVFKNAFSRVKFQQKQINRLKKTLFELKQAPQVLKDKVFNINSKQVVIFSENNSTRDFLSDALDVLKQKAPQADLFIAYTLSEGRIIFVVSRSRDKKISCADIARYISAAFSGSGGGKENFAFAGAKAGPEDSLAGIEEKLKKILEENLK